jgi:hypothetical protein
MALACGAACWLPAQAESQTSVSGTLRADYYSSTRDLDDASGGLGVTGQVAVKHVVDDNLHLEAEARLTENRIGRRHDETLRWQKAFAAIRSGDLDFRIGQQRIRWGKADVVNPTDFFTPIDFRAPLPLEEDRYLSIAALRADWRIDDTKTLSLVVQPDFVPSELPSPPAAAAFDVREDQRSSSFRPQWGLRFERSGEQLDWSLSGFSGYTNLPVLTAQGISPQGRPQFLRHYPRMDGFGADMARTFGPWNVRMEAARLYYHQEGSRTSPFPQDFAVAGVDRNFDDLNVNMQVLYRHTRHFRTLPASASPLEQAASDQNAILFNEFRDHTWGLTSRIAAHWLNHTLQTELLYVAYFRPDSGFLRPLLTYALSDTQKIIIGGEYYLGQPRSYFGSFAENRTFFAEFQVYLN